MFYWRVRGNRPGCFEVIFAHFRGLIWARFCPRSGLVFGGVFTDRGNPNFKIFDSQARKVPSVKCPTKPEKVGACVIGSFWGVVPF